MFWSGEKGKKRGANFFKKLYHWKSNIYPFYSLTTKVNIFVYFINDWFSVYSASIFEKWKGGCAFGYGFQIYSPASFSRIVFPVACFGLADGFLCRKTIDLLFFVGGGLCGLVLGSVGLFSIKNEDENTENGHGWWKKCYFCGAHPSGKGFRGAAGLDSGRRPAFFLFLGV